MNQLSILFAGVAYYVYPIESAEQCYPLVLFIILNKRGGGGGGSDLLSVIKFLRRDESFRSLVLIVNVE